MKHTPPAGLVSSTRKAVQQRGETHYAGASQSDLAAYPPKERWDEWVELDSAAWPQRVEQRSTLIPTTCFNCESACGLLAYVDTSTGTIRKLEGNPEHPGSRGRNCAKGPATLNQIHDPDRILHPLKRVGARGEGQWAPVSWDEALDDIADRIRSAIIEGRHNEVMYHVGRPGEDGFTERILAAWGVDGHNSHTNVCSSGGRAGYHYWMGFDRPSPDHANAEVIVLISAHLESGHYFNPHAQRILDAKARGAKIVVFDTRLSNSATHADHWLPTYPGSEAAVLLAIANYVIQHGRYDRAFVRRWWNWQEFLAAERPELDCTFEQFEDVLQGLFGSYTLAFAAQESGVSQETIAAVAELVSRAGTRLSTHTWRSAAAGNLGGWQVSRCLFLLNALLGAVATPGGVYPNGWHKHVPRPLHVPSHPHTWNPLTWPDEYPLALNELSFLLPQFLSEGRGRLAVYFTRVYNPVWTNPDGFSWIRALRDSSAIDLHVALTPTWSETATYADYVLPMGLAPERHDVHSYETHDARWIGFRQPVRRAFEERQGRPVTDTRDTNPGEVWEENEFWIELTWRLDPDGSLGIRQHVESRERPGEKLGVDEYYGYLFDHSVPGLPEHARKEGLTPLEYMRRYGAFELTSTIGALHEELVGRDELTDMRVEPHGRVYARSTPTPSPNVVPQPTPDPDAEGRRAVGVRIDGEIRRGFPTPSGRLEFYSTTLARWGWREHALPTYIKSHVHPDCLQAGELPLISTFRLPVHIHTRSANAKWLDEIAHTNPLWIHDVDANRLGLQTGDLVRVETAIGYFVVKAWVTEGIRPGVVACSHHMGRWRVHDHGQRQHMSQVSMTVNDSVLRLSRRAGVGPYASADADTQRVWWSDAGVHQNLAFAVHPDPVSGQHCWHQAVRIRKASPEDRYGDIEVDGTRAQAEYRRWIALARSAYQVSPDGTRRPYWLLRPLKPARTAYQLPDTRPAERR